MIFGTFCLILVTLCSPYLEAYPRRSDLAIALDVSNSISTTTFSSTIAFIKQHLYSKSISSGTTRVGLITFASKAYLKFSFEKYVNREGLYKRLEKLRRWRNKRKLKGRTNIGSALKKAIYLFHKYPGLAKIKELYIFTDGKFNEGNNPAIPLKLLRRKRIKIIVFAIGKKPSIWNLKQISKHWFRLKRGIGNNAKVLKRLNRKSVSYGLCSKPGKHIDECNRHCTCTDGVLTDCYRLRREFTSMTLKERKHYIKVYKTLTTKEPLVSRFKVYIIKHSVYFWKGIHNDNQLLPWHRWYIYEFENRIREVDCRVTLPYWDWSFYSKVAWKKGQHIWREDEYGFGGNGSKADSYCVTTGPFRDGIWKPPGFTEPKKVIAQVMQTMHITTLTGIDYKICLRRFFNHRPSNVSHVLNTLTVACSNDGLFHKRFADYHNDMHNYIGGSMNSIYASNAPVFFFHHGFLDNIWYRWQMRHPQCSTKYYDENPIHLIGSKYESREFTDSHSQGQSVNVKYKDFLTGRLDPKIFKLKIKINDNLKDVFPSSDSASESRFMSPFTILKLQRLHRESRGKNEK